MPARRQVPALQRHFGVAARVFDKERWRKRRIAHDQHRREAPSSERDSRRIARCTSSTLSVSRTRPVAARSDVRFVFGASAPTDSPASRAVLLGLDAHVSDEHERCCQQEAVADRRSRPNDGPLERRSRSLRPHWRSRPQRPAASSSGVRSARLLSAIGPLKQDRATNCCGVSKSMSNAATSNAVAEQGHPLTPSRPPAGLPCTPREGLPMDRTARAEEILRELGPRSARRLCRGRAGFRQDASPARRRPAATGRRQARCDRLDRDERPA